MDAFNAADAQRHLQDVSEVRDLASTLSVFVLASRRTTSFDGRVKSSLVSQGSKPRTPSGGRCIYPLLPLGNAGTCLLSSDFMQMNIHRTEVERRWTCGICDERFCCIRLLLLNCSPPIVLPFFHPTHIYPPPNAPTPHHSIEHLQPLCITINMTP